MHVEPRREKLAVWRGSIAEQGVTRTENVGSNNSAPARNSTDRCRTYTGKRSSQTALGTRVNCGTRCHRSWGRRKHRLSRTASMRTSSWNVSTTRYRIFGLQLLDQEPRTSLLSPVHRNWTASRCCASTTLEIWSLGPRISLVVSIRLQPGWSRNTLINSHHSHHSLLFSSTSRWVPVTFQTLSG